MTFHELNLKTPLLNALNDLGFSQPTTIQHKAFSVIMSGKDVVGIAQTGTGKTFAYLLPCLMQWKYAKDKVPQVLILVPTRELVVQVEDEIQKLAKYLSVTTLSVYGGTNINTQVNEAMKGSDIVIATPGRLIDLVLKGAVKIKSIKKLVIDEMDEMLNLGFRAQLTMVLDMVPQRRQNILFSATITDEVETLIQQHFNQPVKVEAAPTGTPLANIIQTAHLVPNFYTKINLLKHLLSNAQEMQKVLVFAATKSLADQLFEQLETDFPEQLGVIHTNKAQNHRFNIVKQFHHGNCRILIATDVVARGIDISEVTHVINFDIPELPENYIHRIGRTGRADKKGIAITFITPNDTDTLHNIEALMNYKIPQAALPMGIEISERLTKDEMPKPYQPNMDIKAPAKKSYGPAFHKKSDKNSKTPTKVRHEEKMHLKYGKPKTRGQKKK
jgi:ATP-dependent RNA helicase RhlE